ncbi:MAG: 1-acyl-sn-glycerol-3-phosphate acyltransferase [Chloroflexi bacterium]|nr:1-acyl-sn-glycerol-3-phosphate acyltransferase [Chloroflexota bacterium]
MKNPTTFHVSFWLKIRRWLLRTTFRPVFRILCHIEITGLENIPSEGAYIIAYNHVSLFEPPFILAFWPSAPEALSGADVFFRPGQSFMVRAYGAIPVKRDQYDRIVIDKMMALLQAGRPLVLSPEGGRSHKPGLRQALPGVAFLMDQAKVPVLPVGIVGGTNDMLSKGLRGEKPHLELRIGPSFILPPIEGKGETRRQARQRNADLVMLHIASLLPKDYHGMYSELVSKKQ